MANTPPNKPAAPPPVKTKAIPKAPTTPPTETLAVQWTVKVEDTDIALTTPSTTATVGCPLKIGEEWMTVKDLSNMDNLNVYRGAFESTAAQHEVGAAVEIYGTISGISPGTPAPPSEEEVKEQALSGYKATAQQSSDPFKELADEAQATWAAGQKAAIAAAAAKK
jgi:hypothetical protein